MAHAITDMQRVWDCRWARVGSRVSRVEDQQDQPEDLWMCEWVPDRRRLVTEEECSTCRVWEPDPFCGPCGG
ncbi:MAG: hypothetical protein HY657_00320 [Acidobacteria bacterium]|nr:hypothetical protein [Acidobacteriota bacterium]